MLLASVLGLAMFAASSAAAEARAPGPPPLSDELQDPVAPDLPAPRSHRLRQRRQVRRVAPTAGASVWNEGWLNCGTRWSSPYGLSISPPSLINNSGQTDYAAWRPWLYFRGYGWYEGDWEYWFTVPAGTTLYGGVGAIGFGEMPAGRNLYIAGALEIYWWNTKTHLTDIFRVNVPDFGAGNDGPYYCHYA